MYETYYIGDFSMCKNECPNNGDINNDCSDCAYGIDYHFYKGECIQRLPEKSAYDLCTELYHKFDALLVKNHLNREVRMNPITAQVFKDTLLTISKKIEELENLNERLGLDIDHKLKHMEVLRNSCEDLVVEYNTRLTEYVVPMLDEHGIVHEIINLENAQRIFKGMKTKAGMII